MPIFTTSVMRLLVYPSHFPLRTDSQKTFILFKTLCTSLIIFTPSNTMGLSERLRRAVCSTLLFSVKLTRLPANMRSRWSSTLRSLTFFFKVIDFIAYIWKIEKHFLKIEMDTRIKIIIRV